MWDSLAFLMKTLSKAADFYLFRAWEMGFVWKIDFRSIFCSVCT